MIANAAEEARMVSPYVLSIGFAAPEPWLPIEEEWAL